MKEEIKPGLMPYFPLTSQMSVYRWLFPIFLSIYVSILASFQENIGKTPCFILSKTNVLIIYWHISLSKSGNILGGVFLDQSRLKKENKAKHNL